MGDALHLNGTSGCIPLVQQDSSETNTTHQLTWHRGGPSKTQNDGVPCRPLIVGFLRIFTFKNSMDLFFFASKKWYF